MNWIAYLILGAVIAYFLVVAWGILTMLSIGRNTWDEEEDINDYQERMRKNSE